MAKRDYNEAVASSDPREGAGARTRSPVNKLVRS